MQRIDDKSLFFLALAALSGPALGGCGVAVGAGATAGTMAMEERGFGEITE